MSIFSAVSKVSGKILNKFGVEATFTQETSTSFDPVLGADTVTSVIFTGYGVKSEYSKAEIDGTVIQNGDVKFILELTETVPKVGDKVTINGSLSYRIMNIKHVAPSEEDVIYILQLRI